MKTLEKQYFTLVEMLVVIAIIALVIAIVHMFRKKTA